MKLFKVVVCIGALAALAACSREVELTLFKDVTESAGLAGYAGMTHGAAWGDFDGDGLPDLYVTNHLNAALLFRNLGGGRFADVTSQVFTTEQLGGDKHGAAWADFDNDGRLDLVQLTGAVSGVGEEPKRLFRNLGAQGFADVAGPMGVINPQGRTRMPLWLDLDNDGRLDLFEGAEARLDDKSPPFVFLQTPTGFTASEPALKLASRGAPFCVITQLAGGTSPGLVCRLMGQGHAVQVFDLAGLPARSLDLLPQTAFEDIAAADLDNDGLLDLFLARKAYPGPVAFGRPSDRQVIASVAIDRKTVGQPMGFSFRAKGPVQFQVATEGQLDAITPEKIHLGANGAHPAALRFSASATIGALGAVAPGAQMAVHVGFSAPDQWEVRITAPRQALLAGHPKSQVVQVSATSEVPLAQLQAVGETAAEEAPARLFMNRGNKWLEESDKRGVNQRLVAGVNVVAGDFDNDMDVDLFVLASGDIGQQENLLLLNDGKGHFKVVKAAGGAVGSRRGVGDSVTMVDADGDGWLDLFITHGGSMGRSLGLPSDGGGYKLYRNTGEVGKGHHWIAIDLQGTKSNRDGIGAVVRVTAGGVTQTRLQDGGIHHRGQNHSRLHFGLAKYGQADKISVLWPSGAVQELAAVPGDRVLKIVERP